MSIVRKAGTTDVSVVIRIIDSADGTPETGVTSATGGLALEYRREGAVSTAITEADLTNLNDAHSDGGMKHIGNGYYRLDLPDAACASGSTGVLVHGVATGMVVIGEYVQLVAYDPFDTVRLGLTALPNAAADAAGGLPISDAGGLDLDAKIGALTFTIANKVDANVTHISGDSAAADNAEAFFDGTGYAGTNNVIPTVTAVTTVNGLAANVITAASLAADAGAEIADAVWDEATAGHTTAGTTGKALTDAGSAGDPWSTALPGAYGAGTAGSLLGRVPDIAAGSAGGLFIAGTNAATTVAITGNITGNLSGSVGSVTGAVGSVTGNVGGNVAGSVDSVTGAVGSVTGNVGGNVAGSVASVTAGVTVTTNNDKTGYALSATGSAAMTEGYAALGAAATLPQLLYEVRALLAEKSISGTTLTAKKLDGSTTAATYTLDDATTPSAITRAT